MKKDCFLYCRTSTTDQITSIKAQENFKSNEYNILEIFSDFGKSATKVKNRPQFIDMLNKCGVKIVSLENKIVFLPNGKKPQTNLIIVSHTSRFMRNAKYMEDVLDTLKEVGVEVRFLDMNKSSYDIDFKFTLSILFLLDEQESRNTSIKVKNGLKKAREQRQYLHYGFGNMLGLDYIKEENRLVKNKDSHIVENIFIDYGINKLSMRELANKYNKTADKIRRILMNEKYCGYNAYNKYNEDNRSTLKENYEIFESDRIEAIITKELFDKCQEIRLSRKNSDGGGKATDTYSLSSKIICSQCGKSYFHKAKNKKGDTWCCITKHNSKQCDNPNVNEDLIIKYINQNLNRYKEITQTLINLSKERLIKIDITNMQNELLKLQTSKDKLLDLYLTDESFDKETYLFKNAMIESNINSINSEIKKAQSIDESIEYLEKLQNSYNLQFNLFHDILNNNKYDIFNYISKIQVSKNFDVASNSIKPNIDYVIFKGFEKLHELEISIFPSATKFY
ncbi:recombinase family protein [Clostridium perfringens]|uniref:recombinase family protein n=1 Tax=Clostridium perfringens TaxID=1502 RepID=UPI0013E387A7|nr:recombinase family protein [Clostridium perfringens]EJT6154781.1 recombinase family protein [Clostridium perfringens]MDM0627271.1 recombinase family protein [Clostridium perfringens]QPS27977.1 recombinase family protein [Clostridium perfringens]HAT4244527.1 recombinase family protein [Clostridium perfringens]